MSEMKFSKDHEWVRMEGDAATIGITDHAQNALGDVVFVDLPEVGREVTAGEACAVVESVKAASDVYAPIAGRIVEVNSALVRDPGAGQQRAHRRGWFFRIEPQRPRPRSTALMDAAAYAALRGERWREQPRRTRAPRGPRRIRRAATSARATPTSPPCCARWARQSWRS